MDKIIFIAPTEMVAGLRLAGVVVKASRNVAEARDIVLELMENHKASIVILPEHIAAQFDRREYHNLMESDHPCFIPLPMDWNENRDARRDFEHCLGQILGFKITLTDQILGRSLQRDSAL